MPVLFVVVSGTRIDHPLLMLACLAWSVVALLAVFYIGMMPIAPAEVRRMQWLQNSFLLSLVFALGGFLVLGFTGVHNAPR